MLLNARGLCFSTTWDCHCRSCPRALDGAEICYFRRWKHGCWHSSICEMGLARHCNHVYLLGGYCVHVNNVIMLYWRISGRNSNLDTPWAMGALVSYLAIFFLITSFKWNGPDATIIFENSIYSANGNPWWSGGRAHARQNRAEFLSKSGKVAPRETLWNNPRRASAWFDSPVKG